MGIKNRLVRFLVVPVLITGLLFSCKKENNAPPVTGPFDYTRISVNQVKNGFHYYGVNATPPVRISFSLPVKQSSVAANISFQSDAGAAVPVNYSYEDNDSTILITPTAALTPITGYTLAVSQNLQSVSGKTLLGNIHITLVTAIDSTDKFPKISDSALLTLVQQQTFRYFWDFGHPVSGMARERNSSGDVCATGGTGFGIMSILVGISRNFISRAEGLGRVQQIVGFLLNKCTRYHGAFSHWINGATGATVPFSTNDNGADLVETSYLMEGLLCARQYFDQNDVAEDSLRNGINTLWNGVEWNWFRQNGQNALYWHWSPDKGWIMNMQINGWNEALITYVLAASSNTDSIPRIVYDNGWAGNGGMKNGKSFFGIPLPLGPDYGGPLFFSHYSFLGINPHGLSDAYANYWTQDTAQAGINYLWCVNNPLQFNGYSSLCWGLTASDDNINGYAAHSPTNDDGVITPTAAISSLPYTPAESMNALRFFYYKLGDRIWGQYGFSDAFNLTKVWFANSYLAIDQGPEIVMIENYRSGLIWNLFMGCPEVKRGLKNLGFQGPYL